jgi:hypothetical protein
MAEGFQIAADQVRGHARNITAIQDRFRAVKAASAHITQNDAAYGTLCQWMPAVLESRHKRQDELLAYVEENLSLVAQALRRTAELYEDADNSSADRIHGVAADLW